MRNFVRLLILAMLSGWNCGAVFGALPEIGRGPAPSWVEPLVVDLAAARPLAELDAGRNVLLIDRQVDVESATRYVHVANAFLNQNAVEEGSRISVSFEPSYEQLTFHKLTVYREGKPVERLAGQEIKLLQREARLDWHLYDGRLSAVLILEDIRVGDVLEYAYSVRGKNPIFAGRFMDALQIESDEPVHHLRFRLLWPTARRLAYQVHGQLLPATITRHDAVTEYLWEQREIPARISDGSVPGWFSPWSWLQLSEFESWQDVAQWANQIYRVPQTVPAELAKELAPIATLPTEQARVLAALRFVQDNIRYLGIEIGENSFKPYPIETILARRFGDCKDKALLLCTMLRQLGFEAWPALVATDERQTIADGLPTALAFDHLVVQLRLAQGQFWLDPTNRDQGGPLDQLFFPAYGQALVIEPATVGLSVVRPGGFETTFREIVETFDFQDFSGATQLRVHTVWSGGQADEIRAYLADNSLASICKSYLNFYARLYPHIESIEPAQFHDDREHNLVTATESYRISKFWQASDPAKSRISGDFSSQTLQGILARPQTSLRTMPFALRYPSRVLHTTEINLPRALGLKREEIKVEDPAFELNSTQIPFGNKVTIRRVYQTKRDHVAVSAITEYLAKLDRASAVVSEQISVPKTWAASGMFPKASSPTPAPSAAMPTVAPRVSPPRKPWSWVTITCLCILGAAFSGRKLLSRRTPAVEAVFLHRCVVCGRTESSHPELEFRVARTGDDYCSQHLPQ